MTQQWADYLDAAAAHARRTRMDQDERLSIRPVLKASRRIADNLKTASTYEKGKSHAASFAVRCGLSSGNGTLALTA